MGSLQIVRAHVRPIEGSPSTEPAFLFSSSPNLRGFYSEEDGNWVLVTPSNMYPSLEIDGNVISAAPEYYNGLPMWGGVFYSRVEVSWIYFPGWSGVEPYAYQKLDGTWVGDGWWELSGRPRSGFTPGLTPKGTFIDTQPTPPTIRWHWPRWTRRTEESGDSPEPFGVYKKAMDEITPEKYTVGCESYRATADDQSLGYYKRSLSDTDEEWAGPLGTLHKDNGGWLVGSRARRAGTGATWFVASGKPTRESGCTLTPMHWPAEAAEPVQDADRPVVTLAFAGYFASGETGTVRMAEVAQWR